MKNIPKKYHSQVRKLIKKAREEGYEAGRKDGIVEMAKYSKITLLKLKSALKRNYE